MNQLLLGILFGIGLGLILLVVGMNVFMFFHNFMEKRLVKQLIRHGKFLQPIDKEDYDGKHWDSVMDLKKNKESYDNLNEKIFKEKKFRKGKGVKETESYGFTGDKHGR